MVPKNHYKHERTPYLQPSPPQIPPLHSTTLSTRPPKRMRLSIQHPLIQTHHVRLAIQQVKILQRLREPETLHRVLLIHLCPLAIHTPHGAVPDLGARGGDDGFEHCPALFGPDGGAGDAVQVEDGFDCFGAGDVSWLGMN